MGGSLHVLLGEVFRAAFAIQLFAAPVLQLDTFSVGRTPPDRVVQISADLHGRDVAGALSVHAPVSFVDSGRQTTSRMWHLSESGVQFQIAASSLFRATCMFHLG